MPPAEETMLSQLYSRLRSEAAKAVVGQETVLEQIAIALLSGGHVLLEGVPGTGKTLLARILAGLVHAEFRRIQFTPDLMPSDIMGTQVFDLETGRFHLKKGPLFTQIALADEINRAPAKTQSALLEAMEERQITIEGESHPLDDPFMVLATQNPVEYEGTYPLPEAQLDRFMFKLLVDYPAREVEQEILRRYHGGFSALDLRETGLQPVVAPAQLPAVREAIQAVTVEDGVFEYITAIAEASRQAGDLILGGSPRASISLLLGSKTWAALQGRDFVTPDDVKGLVAPVYRHRVMLRPESEIEGLDEDLVMQRIVARIPVPR